MSLSKTYTVNCDADGTEGLPQRSDRCKWWVAETLTAAAARRVARAAGWTRIPRSAAGPLWRGADLCPACAPGLPAESPVPGGEPHA